MPIHAANGRVYYDRSHPLAHGVPQWPSSANLNIRTLKFHAKDGVMVQQYEGILHRTTHMDAENHVTENGRTLGEYEPWRFFGTGVAVSIPKEKWEVITPDDLENARPRIEPGDILMINTGMHNKLADTDEYYAYSPGLYKEAGEWIVNRVDRQSRREDARHRYQRARTSARNEARRSRPGTFASLAER
jgi:kynurenine formamidase